MDDNSLPFCISCGKSYEFHLDYCQNCIFEVDEDDIFLCPKCGIDIHTREVSLLYTGEGSAPAGYCEFCKYLLPIRGL